MDDKQAKELRKPFPASAIGRLPKGGVMLDYVGHAATTDRLLTVDPEWTWEPLALGEDGLPAMDKAGNLWIRLTLCGVTRIGVGDGMSQKERIGDAIRNAAMRFGVALDLWAKEDLHEISQTGSGAETSQVTPAPEPPATTRMSRGADKPITTAQSARMFALFGERGITDRDVRLAGIAKVIGREITSSKDMTSREASLVIDTLAPPTEPED